MVQRMSETLHSAPTSRCLSWKLIRETRVIGNQANTRRTIFLPANSEDVNRIVSAANDQLLCSIVVLNTIDDIAFEHGMRHDTRASKRGISDLIV